MNQISEDGRTQLDIERIVTYWLTEAKEALQVAEHLVDTKDYSYALFFGHLAVEKMLKALYVHHLHQHAPLTHNLTRLAQLAGLELTEKQIAALATITAFNIEARYPDLKRDFREQCTAEFTALQMASVKEVFAWLKFQILSE